MNQKHLGVFTLLKNQYSIQGKCKNALFLVDTFSLEVLGINVKLFIKLLTVPFRSWSFSTL